jgi:hypothetical protein
VLQTREVPRRGGEGGLSDRDAYGGSQCGWNAPGRGRAAPSGSCPRRANVVVAAVAATEVHRCTSTRTDEAMAGKLGKAGISDVGEWADGPTSGYTRPFRVGGEVDPSELAKFGEQSDDTPSSMSDLEPTGDDGGFGGTYAEQFVAAAEAEVALAPTSEEEADADTR